MELKDRLLFLREKNGYSQQHVANILGIHKSLYCNYEKAHRTPDLERLQKLAELYEVPLKSLIIFPLKNVVIYSDGLLDELEQIIRQNETIGSDLAAVRAQYQNVRPIFDRVMNERNEAMDFPDFNIDISDYVGQTVKTVTLDVRGEYLLKRAWKLQMQQLELLTGFHAEVVP